MSKLTDEEVHELASVIFDYTAQDVPEGFQGTGVELFAEAGKDAADRAMRDMSRMYGFRKPPPPPPPQYHTSRGAKPGQRGSTTWETGWTKIGLPHQKHHKGRGRKR